MYRKYTRYYRVQICCALSILRSYGTRTNHSTRQLQVLQSVYDTCRTYLIFSYMSSLLLSLDGALYGVATVRSVGDQLQCCSSCCERGLNSWTDRRTVNFRRGK